jgi:hypothetical protein
MSVVETCCRRGMSDYHCSERCPMFLNGPWFDQLFDDGIHCILHPFGGCFDLRFSDLVADEFDMASFLVVLEADKNIVVHKWHQFPLLLSLESGIDNTSDHIGLDTMHILILMTKIL